MNSIGSQFGIHVIYAYLIEFVDSHSDVDYLVGLANDFGNARENLPVVDFDGYPDTKTGEHRIHNLHQFHLIEQRIAAHDVGITLIELTVTAFLRTISSPHRLNLITFERQLQLVAMHDDKTGKWHGEVVTEAFFAHPCGQRKELGGLELFGLHLGQIIAGVENFE